MRNAADLPPDELVEIVQSIQELAFLDDGRVDAWNPDKPLGSDFIQEVCSLLVAHDLAP